MHKKLSADLTSLAHSILQMKNKEDVFALKTKAYEVYEKLAVLAYIEEYINNTPNPEHSKEDLIALVENESKKLEDEIIEETKTEEVKDITQESIVDNVEEIEPDSDIVKHNLEDTTFVEDVLVEKEYTDEELENDKEDETVEEIVLEEIKKEPILEEPLINFEPVNEENLFTESTKENEEDNNIQEQEIEVEENSPTLEEELKDTIAVDVVADLFENAPKKSLNDKLQGDIQIGLNDRIAFVKNLFGGSQEDFNRVVSQLNTLKTEKEAKKFINKMVKPDYDWTDKEELEERFMTIVERKFN